MTSCFEHVTTHSRWVKKISESGVLPWCERMQWEKPRPNITTTTTTHSPRHAPTHAPTHARPGLPVDQIPNPVANKAHMILLLAIKLFLHTFFNQILALLHNWFQFFIFVQLFVLGSWSIFMLFLVCISSLYLQVKIFCCCFLNFSCCCIIFMFFTSGTHGLKCCLTPTPHKYRDM